MHGGNREAEIAQVKFDFSGIEMQPSSYDPWLIPKGYFPDILISIYFLKSFQVFLKGIRDSFGKLFTSTSPCLINVDMLRSLKVCF